MPQDKRRITRAEQIKEDRRISLEAANAHMEAVVNELNYLILATPSSEIRNLLTEVNIHAIEAQSKLKEVKD